MINLVQIETVWLFMGAGARLNIQDSLGKTALDVAYEGNYPEIVDVLKRAGD